MFLIGWLPDSVFAVIVLVLILFYAFRKQILNFIGEKYAAYKEQRKFDALYARLDSNKAGRFSRKEYLKELDRQKKMQMKKNRDLAIEKKAVEKKK